MKSPTKLLKLILATLTAAMAAWAVSACTEGSQSRAPEKGDPIPANLSLDPFTYRPFDENPFATAPKDAATIKATVADAYKEQPVSEDLFALAHCNCGDGTKAKILKLQAESKGVLPQIIVPPIRAEIAGNTALSTLAKLPFGLGDLLGGLFATDEKIAEQIRKGLQEKINAGTPGGSTLAERVPFRFDAFINRADDTSFAIKNQIPRWYFTFATPGLWDNSDPIDGEDHGLQVLELLRVMMEWNYIMGLEKDADGKVFGGLTRDVEKGLEGDIGPFDPRVDKGARHYVSGKFRITIPKADSDIDLAKKAAEKWQGSIETLPLVEQASLWLAAAKAFSRLRADRRQDFSKIFGKKGEALLPDDAHNLALAFLPSLDGLLDGHLINRDTRTIFAKAQFDTKDPTDRAPLVALIRLISAIVTWREALTDIDQAQVVENQLDKLREAPKSMKPAAQLAIFTILGGYGTKDSPSGIGLKVAPDKLGLAAETLFHLIQAEKSMPSPFLKARLEGLCHWFAAVPLQNMFRDGSAEFGAADIVWTYAVLDLMGDYLTKEPTWLQDAKNQVEELLP